jgi:hypothetical protein
MNDLAMYKLLTSGKVTVNNGSAGPTAVLAAVTNKTIVVMQFTISVTTAATGGGGVVNVLDGTTAVWTFDANTVGNIVVNLGNRGYVLTQGNALQISVTGAITLQATANITATGLVSA